MPLQDSRASQPEAATDSAAPSGLEPIGPYRRRRPDLPEPTSARVLNRLPPDDARRFRERDEQRVREAASARYGTDADLVVRWDRADRLREAQGRPDSLRLRCAKRGCGLALGRISLASYGDDLPYHVLVSPVGGDEHDAEHYSLRCPGKACRATPYLKRRTLAIRYVEAIEAGSDDIYL